MNTLANDLERARFEIATKGLYKGAFEGPEESKGPCCMAGAINRVCEDGATNRTYNRWTAATTVLEWATPGGNIPNFNDRPSTKKEDVLSVFDVAISLALSNEV
jgi:hypothetical protein